MSAALDKKPFFWALAIVALLLIVWQIFAVIGEQRLHNTAWWQARYPVVLRSLPQTATPVDVRHGRLSQVAVQTEKGVYFLTGDRYVFAPHTPVVVKANARWEIYLCEAKTEDEHCMSIHSFCANADWAHMQRDESGRVAGCEAPNTADGTQSAVAAITSPPPDRAGRPGGRSGSRPPALGMRHPRLWAQAMGLPVQN